MAGDMAPIACEALRGVRAVEVSTGLAAAFAGRILADLGAEVVLVEPGDGSRRRHGGRLRPEFVYFDAGKRSRVLDPNAAAGRADLTALIDASDVVVTDDPRLAREHASRADGSGAPGPVITVVTPFGTTGPYADYASTHLVQCAMGAWAAGCGTPDREPLQAGRNLTDAAAGAYAAVATIAALLGRDRDGLGDLVDVSIWESAITCAFCPTLLYEYRGDLPTQNSAVATGPSFHIPCRGGYVGVNVLTDAQWETTCLFIERADLLEDPRFATAVSRAQHAAEIEQLLRAALAERDAVEVFRTAQEWRLPYGLVVTPSQALQLEPHDARRFLEPVTLPDDGREVRIPRLPFVMSATPPRVSAPPRLGDADPAVDVRAPASAAPAPSRQRTSPPLAGVRIVDFTAFQAGPMATLMAADLGADVIKIEAVQRMDGWRGIGRGDVRPWEASGPFHWANRGKRGITLNLNDERGLALVRRLIAQADVVVENFTPRVMRQYGLDYPRLSAEHPSLVMVSMPGYGTTGPWSEYASFAYPAEQLSTISHQTGYADGPPLFTGTPVGDVAAALMAATAMLAAIRHQQRTGVGQHIDVSQLEAATSFTGEALIAAQLFGDERTRQGNDHPDMAPHGTYPCRGGRWLAIACRNDDDWERLVRSLDDSTRARCAPAWSTADGRRAARRDIDALLASWTRAHDAAELMHQLQAAGVPAGVVMNGADLLADEHLWARGFFVEHHGIETGVTHCPAQPFRYATTPMAPPRRAPRLGEHTREVLQGLLGVTDGELDELERDHVIGTEPLRVSAI